VLRVKILAVELIGDPRLAVQQVLDGEGGPTVLSGRTTMPLRVVVRSQYRPLTR
jgi:hypothetical protein